MKLFVADECSVSWDERIGFFIYGGLVIDEADARSLAQELLSIKSERGIPKERPVKWTNNKWRGSLLDEGLHKETKDAVLTLVETSAIKIIVCLSPHSFYHTLKPKVDKSIKMILDLDAHTRTHEYGFNDAVSKFNNYLGTTEWGLVLVDRFGDSVKTHMDAHCANIFPNNITKPRMDRIIHPIIQLENEESYLHQINDVVLGAIFYSLREMELNLLPKLRSNFWCRDAGVGADGILGYGFTVYPRMPQYDSVAIHKARVETKFLRLVGGI